jgi:hypothetical protein
MVQATNFKIFKMGGKYWPDQEGQATDIKSHKNRLLKVCYVPATSTDLPRVSFFFSLSFLLLQLLTVLMKQTRQAVRAIKQSIFLDVYGAGSG